ncbi:MAG: acyl-CoA/acyl-ACP dehydrogenase [Intrasporangium sp.]|uniref:acyl-CoA dehydrogenase family protein n=1 Tax=Intrasporangium sp. TaxID=1925024 RepID=UPI002649A609|nr:acyl-CoA dehydrogenase family protein [Intrasporangium sp.]MDN5794426.1 acyl-CoA/acyl-ACP dehydrogenase [Intrasporangium sp.]
MTMLAPKLACCDDLGAHLAPLRAQARGWAGELVDASARIEATPEDVSSLLDHEAPRWLATAGIPQDEGGRPLEVDGHRYEAGLAVEQVVVMEELARVNPALVVASPGPSMAGVLVRQLGSRDQRRIFHDRLLAAPTWTFFALTEPGQGSDASSIQTAVERRPDGSLSICGTKRYIGNGARARLGVVFARSSAGPLGIGAYLVDAPAPGLRARTLQTVGMRPVQLSELAFDRVIIDPDRLIGGHLPASRRGVRAFLGVFNQLRPGVAALALGIARGALAIAGEVDARPGAPAAEVREQWHAECAATARLVHDAAADADLDGTGSLASMAKLRACWLAEQVTLDIADQLGPTARTDVPALDVLIRAARGVEFMEGTRNVQLLTTFHRLVDTSGSRGERPPR